MTRSSTRSALTPIPLTSLGQSEGIQFWVDALASRNWIDRHDARKHLARLGAAAVAPVSALIGDRREPVRWEAAKTLSDMGSPAAAPALVVALTDEDSFGVRWVAAEGLARLGRDGLAALFEALMVSPRSVYLRFGAHHVLIAAKRRGDAELVEPVLEALGGFFPQFGLPLVAREALIKLRQDEDLLAA